MNTIYIFALLLAVTYAYGCDENCVSHNMICDEDSFKCICPEGKTGENCDSDINDADGKSTPVPNCPLKPVPSKPNFYMLGGFIRPCAKGTKFSLFKCTCVHDNE